MVRNLFALLPLLALSTAAPDPILRRDTTCPAVWTTIAADLTREFVGSDGQCTDLARAAIRFAFHDAGTYSSKTEFYLPAAGGADGSLLLNEQEIFRQANNGLGAYQRWLWGKYNQYKQIDTVGAADLVQFAGSVGIVSCPGGPRIKTVVGREDSSQAPPDGLLPAAFGPNSSHDVLFQLFLDKGFSATDLAALMGAHTSSRSFTAQSAGIPVGAGQDSTPGKWDVTYYADTYNPPSGVGRFQSDINLSNTSTTVGKEFQSFVGSQGKWNAAFVDAMARLSVLGIPLDVQQGFIDCTSALPKGSIQRDIRNAPINDRIR